MSCYLLDVNLLIALFDPMHVFHNKSHDWFSSIQDEKWGSCPITQNALIRILSSPSYSSIDLLPNQIVNYANEFISKSKRHVFLIENISLLDPKIFDHNFIHVHKQITDIYLLGLATYNKAKLATLDSTIPLKAVKIANKENLVFIN